MRSKTGGPGVSTANPANRAPVRHCQMCGTRALGSIRLSQHHITPRAKGGSGHHENLALLCERCHNWAELHLVSEKINNRASFWVQARLKCPHYQRDIDRRKSAVNETPRPKTWEPKRRVCEARSCSNLIPLSKRPDAKFCSTDCRNRDWQEKHPRVHECRTCENCGEPYKPHTARQKYCSPDCRKSKTETKAQPAISPRASCERCGSLFVPVKPSRGPTPKLCGDCGSNDGRLSAYLTRKGKQADLFIDATPVDAALEVGLGALDATAIKHADLLDRLKPIARELAERSPNGITVSDVRKAAERAGLLNGKETKEELCCLGWLMKSAGLKSTGQMRRSHLEITHGRHQLVWSL